ncbi:hypothetical protein KIH27_06135 [Mycobacterium sp. M1]|uniref:Lipoprotein LpqE n=1 Tax=Mycolicibacter acidiphilus TaxID=2835306 RepID=A0ABS5RHU6_9MYCO|nr:hypothetical protein [Mycolicibacter acidiphilus]MBS9533169.1 hypothetical protein [Mycolicibacter acidiphilus]
MNRFNRACSAAAIGLFATAALAGCGTGQISQTTDQASAVNGSAATVGDLALRDVRIQAVQTGDALKPGDTVDLVFVASNQSLSEADELTGITSAVGKVSVTGSKSLPAGGVLVVSAPVASDLTAAPATPKQSRGADNTSAGAATLTLDKPISNGLTYDFTFDFKRAGEIKLAVPISAEGASHH